VNAAASWRSRRRFRVADPAIDASSATARPEPPSPVPMHHGREAAATQLGTRAGCCQPERPARGAATIVWAFPMMGRWESGGRVVIAMPLGRRQLTLPRAWGARNTDKGRLLHTSCENASSHSVNSIPECLALSMARLDVHTDREAIVGAMTLTGESRDPHWRACGRI